MRELDDRARAILTGNDRGGYTVPTRGLYPYQWNWDSAFAAMGFSAFDPDRAWRELETLFAAQWETGMVPHIIFHEVDPGYFPGPDVWQTHRQPPTTGITQPPVAATAARRIYERDHDRARLAALYPKMLAWHRWFAAHRLDRGAVCIAHPWEAGRDNAPDWDGAMAGVDSSGVGEYTRRDTAHVDAAMRPQKIDYDRYLSILYFGRDTGWDAAEIAANGPFFVADPSMTFILLRANRDLAVLAGVLGEDSGEIEGWIAELEAGAETLWNADGEYYDSRDVRTGTFANSLSCASYLCWYAGIDNRRMLEHLRSVLGRVRYGVPSYDPEGPEFNALRYWRGPVWGVVNFLIADGLAAAGHEVQADRIRADTRALIERNGFFEYFDPLEGRPAGGDNFTWTAAIWLIWAGRD
ncbi:MGH1-like glycoside hydrolase domain-containing protein [Algicella marina]|uniref:Mannosylglycerate hydrolase MGH1-like glycoside hydrolase domain-containing protein n=1 Tax=Algicella marina TaxID=2683284 RepID=A0A6P1T5H1_9RHOB|nr:hypothetical protein [Algicella marina]QHQ36950.1 hypothetical protein GO499_18060 [Algicella marina]